jgi:ribosome recycling factor
MEEEIKALAAAGLVSSVMRTSLIKQLHKKGLLSNADVREIHEDALLMLEERQGAARASQDAFELARELIEGLLRRPPRSEGKS